MFTDDAEIRRIGEGLITCSLLKAEWTHAAHFAATLWLMRHHPERDLPREMPGLIRAYNESTGGVNSDTAGYHETITQVSLRAARTELARHSADVPLHRIVNTLMASPLGKSGWLLEYWSKELLMSVAARREWREPDLKPLPF